MALQPIYSAEHIAKRYDCSQTTARRYIREMKHMENPLRVTESDLAAWEASRIVEPRDEIMEKAREMVAKRKARA